MVIGTILFIIAIVELILGLWCIFRYKNNPATFWFGFFAIGAAIYVGANALGFFKSIITSDWAEHLAWIGGTVATIFFLPFSYSFPLPRRTFKELWPWVFWPLVIFIPAFIWTELIIERQGLVQFMNGYSTATGPYFWVFLVFFIIYWLWSITNLIKWTITSDGIHRKLLMRLLTVFVVSLAASSYFDVYRPLTTPSQFGYIGSLFTSIWVGYTGYIILKK